MAAGAGVSVRRVARGDVGAESRLSGGICGAGGLVAGGGRAQTGDVAEDLVDDTALAVGGGAGSVVGGGGVVVATEAGVGVCGHYEGSMCVRREVVGYFKAWKEQLVKKEDRLELEEWVKMWKKVMCWGRNGKGVCMYLLGELLS